MHLKRVFESILFMGVLSILAMSCSSEDTRIPQTENEIFNTLLQEAPATIIDLDGIPVDTVFVRSEHILGRESSSHLSEPVYLGFPVESFLKLEDSLYVANRQRMYVMDSEGTWQRSVGRQGQGPGEFDSSLKIANNSEHVFAFDYGNARIHVFDHELNVLFVINKLLYDLHFRKNFALTDTHLYIGLVPHAHDHMAAVYRTDDLENRIDTFWPKIIPDGLQPGPYNNIIIDVNSNETIAITNLGLPYLFLLSPDRTIQKIFYFESSYYRELENPSVKPVNVEGNSELTVPGIGFFIQELIIKDDHSIYFTVRNNLYQMIPGENKYHLYRSWHFVHDEPSLRENSPNGINIANMIIEEGILYFIPLFGEYVFRVELEQQI